MNLIKAHAFGNDFLLLEKSAVREVDLPALARAVCERHRGIGADGLIAYTLTTTGASMQLLNADGSPSEISGNGVRCLAVWIAESRGISPGASIEVVTDAGPKRLELLAVLDGEYTFRAGMGRPERIEQHTLEVGGTHVAAITLRVGNPQCVVLGAATSERLHTIGSALATHPHFPEGTNVELAHVEAPDLVRILIWERGVGPTEASGTGACAAAVAAIRFGGACPDLQVVAPGGTQRVEWLEDGLYLTGSATLVAQVRWLR